MSSDPGYIPNEWNLSTQMNSFPTGIHATEGKPNEDLPDTILTDASTIDYQPGEYGPAKIIGGKGVNSGKHEGFYFKAVNQEKMPGTQFGNVESIIYTDEYQFLEGERVIVEVLPEKAHTELTQRDPLEELNDTHVGGKDLSEML